MSLSPMTLTGLLFHTLRMRSSGKRTTVSNLYYSSPSLSKSTAADGLCLSHGEIVHELPSCRGDRRAAVINTIRHRN